MTLEKFDPNSFDSTSMTTLVRTFVPEAKLLTDAGGEISYQLPFSNSSSFPAMFNYIDGHCPELGGESYGVSVTTLEEVCT